jgi:glutaredoxin-like protein
MVEDPSGNTLMIPLKDQEAIRYKFSSELVNQVKIDYFTEREVSISVPGKQPCQFCKPVREMLQEIAGLGGGLVSLRIHYLDEAAEERAKYAVERVPGIVLRGVRPGFAKFYGMPGGTEFPALLETIVDLSRGEVLLSEESVSVLVELAGDVDIKVFVTPTCQYCPAMMRAVYQLAMVSTHIKAEVIEVNEFPDLADKYKVQAVPLTVINDRVAIPGAIPEKDLVEQVVKAASVATADAGPKRVERGKERPSGLFIP